MNKKFPTFTKTYIKLRDYFKINKRVFVRGFIYGLIVASIPLCIIRLNVTAEKTQRLLRYFAPTPTPYPVTKKPVDQVFNIHLNKPIEIAYTRENTITYKEPLVLSSDESQQVMLLSGNKQFLSTLLESEETHRYDYNQSTNRLVYVKNGYERGFLEQAILHDLRTDEETKLYERARGGPAPFILDGVTNVKISPSGEKIAIGSYDSMFIYDVSQSKLTPVFHIETDVNGDQYGVRYGYFPLYFSDDETHLVINTYYSEWSEPMLVDIQSGNITLFDAAYENRIELGWADQEFLFAKSISRYPQSDYVVEKYDIAGKAGGLKKEYLDTTFLQSQSHPRSFFYIRTQQSDLLYEGPKSGAPIYAKKETLVQVDKNSFEERDLVTLDTTGSEALTNLGVPDQFTQVFEMDIRGKKSIIVQINYPLANDPVFYIVDENSKDVLTPLMLSN